MTAPTSVDPGRISIDPRFRERRIEVRKDAGRRRLRRLLLLVAAAMLALAAVIVLESPILDVDEVSVTGARITSVETIREAAGVDIGAPLLLADLESAAQAIEALPWVDEATVRRDLPNGVTVRVTERSPRALVSSAATAVLVDGTGRVLVAGDDVARASSAGASTFVTVVPPGDLALPETGGTVDRSLLAAISLAGRLGENPAGAVRSIQLEPAPLFHLAGGGRVELGDLTDLDAKVEAFRTVHARVDLECLDAIDLRVPTHPVLTRRTPCS